MSDEKITDALIVELFFERNERALRETQHVYGRYLFSIAKNILGSDEDAEECENDAYLAAWNTIPPQRPASLKSYLSALVRRTALDLFDKTRAGKRGGGQGVLVYEELSEIIGGKSDDPVDRIALRDAMNSFIESLPPRDRVLFVQRYYHIYSIKDIAADNDMRESAVKMRLQRLRQRLAEHLASQGFNLLKGETEQ